MKKACKKCKVLVTEDKCPLCGSTELSDSWKGRSIVLKPAESEIAKKLGITNKGVFAIKTK
jgi:DNA-directed RNA polymerase subunit E"